MLLYLASWKHPNKSVSPIYLTVLCRQRSQALSTIEYYFKHCYKNIKKLDFDDGSVSLSRCKIDSRGFQANFLMLEDMAQPFDLSCPGSNILRLNHIFFTK